MPVPNADGCHLRVQAQMQHLAQLQASQAAAEAAAAREVAAAQAQAQAAVQAASVAKLRDMPQQQRMQVGSPPVVRLTQIWVMGPAPAVTRPVLHMLLQSKGVVPKLSIRAPSCAQGVCMLPNPNLVFVCLVGSTSCHLAHQCGPCCVRKAAAAAATAAARRCQLLCSCC
jgi:hypothetical protein